MITHKYINASDNIAQYVADQIGRQEVTIDWYFANMFEQSPERHSAFRWVENQYEHGLDPWRHYLSLEPFPFTKEQLKLRGWRIFVQKNDMPPSNILSLTREFCNKIKNDRTPKSIFEALLSEVKELQEEVTRFNYGEQSGEDGIPGEVMDVVNCAFDLLFETHPEITNAEIMTIALKKLEKWQRIYHVEKN